MVRTFLWNSKNLYRTSRVASHLSKKSCRISLDVGIPTVGVRYFSGFIFAAKVARCRRSVPVTLHPGLLPSALRCNNSQGCTAVLSKRGFQPVNTKETGGVPKCFGTPCPIRISCLRGGKCTPPRYVHDVLCQLRA